MAQKTNITYYGYKLCYKKHRKVKVYIITDTLNLAKWHIKWFEKNHPPLDQNKLIPILNVEWFVMPILKYKEFKKLYKRCPFIRSENYEN